LFDQKVISVANRVTVAIPVFNGLPHVVTAVQSVLDQTYTDLDVVVIDNDSTDGTRKALATIDDPRFRLIHNDTNVGLEGNWNKALAEGMKSPYFKLVCADDLIYRHAIATEVAILDANSDVVMTAAQRAIIDDNDRTVIKARGLGRMKGKVDGGDAVRRAVAAGTNLFGEPTTAMVRTSALADVGPFDGTHMYCIDFDMWARVLQKGKLFAIREPLGAFRVGELSNSGTLARKQRGQINGEFRKLAADPRYGIDKTRLWRGIVMNSAITEARQVFYKLLDLRKARKSRPSQSQGVSA
jgi:glycosyltransferase involved in cell wall biosynthesis